MSGGDAMIFDSDYFNETLKLESNTQKNDKFNNPVKNPAVDVKVRYIKSYDGLDVKTNTAVIKRVYHSIIEVPVNSKLGGYTVSSCDKMPDAFGDIVAWRVVVI